MINLVLIGASNFGDEIIQLFRDINKTEGRPKFNLVGFLDDDKTKAGLIRNGIPVLGDLDSQSSNFFKENKFICCIGNPKIKKKIVEKVIARGGDFTSGIHPTVILSDYYSVGTGTVITAGNIITTNTIIGNHVIINLACTLGHYSKIGDYCTINPGANISGDVSIEDGVMIGTNAAILEKQTIGENSIIGAGSVVNKSIPENVTAVGVPAKIIKENT